MLHEVCVSCDNVDCNNQEVKIIFVAVSEQVAESEAIQLNSKSVKNCPICGNKLLYHSRPINVAEFKSSEY